MVVAVKCHHNENGLLKLGCHGIRNVIQTAVVAAMILSLFFVILRFEMVQTVLVFCWQDFAIRILDPLGFVPAGRNCGCNTNQLKQATPLKLPSRNF